MLIGVQTPETFKDAKRHESFAIIGRLVIVARGTSASSLPCEWLLYPSKSAFVIKTASPDDEGVAVETDRQCVYSWTACEYRKRVLVKGYRLILGRPVYL